MHLPVLARDGSILLQDYGRIMIQSGSPAFEKREHNDHSQLFGQTSEGFGRRTGNRLCLIKQFGILRLAKIKPVMQFLQYDQFRALLGGYTDIRLQFPDIRFDIRTILLLN